MAMPNFFYIYLVIPPEFRIKFTQEVSCYALPYGIFGLVSWVLVFISTFLTYVNCPPFACWQWCRTYRSQGPVTAILFSSMIVLPVVYTCIKCKAEWEMLLVALGQLTPWSFKMLNDGILARRNSDVARRNGDVA